MSFAEKNFTILPLALVNTLTDSQREIWSDNLCRVTFSITVCAKGEYRCRKVDYNSIELSIDNSDDYPEGLIDFIESHRHCSCNDRKYVAIELTGGLEEDDFRTEECDSYCSITYVDGYAWVYFY
jgi:hypothetical protein